MGVDSTGITIKRIPEIKNDIELSLKSRFGENIKTDPSSTFGSEVSVHSQLQAFLWEEIEKAYLSHTLRGAIGVQLDFLGEIIGRTRLKPVRSFTLLELTGDPNTLVSVGTRYRDSAGLVWVQEEDATIDISGTVLSNIQSENFGAVIAGVGTINTIVDNTTGLSTVTNPNSANVGRDEEPDPLYRTRLYQSARGSSKGIFDALRDSVFEIDGVLYSRLIENTTGVTDAIGLDAHSLMVIVEGGTDEDIANTIWDNKPAGIGTNGAVVVPIVDSSGNPKSVKFERADVVPVYIIVNTTALTSWDGSFSQDMKEAIVVFALAQFGVGDDIINSQLYTPANTIPNHSIDSILIGIAPVPTLEDDIVMTVAQRGDFDVSRVEVIIA